MPRKKTIKQPGVRKYGTISNYTPEMLEEALDKIKSGALSQRKACAQYKIPKSTINLKLKNKHSKPVGRPTCLTMDEEIVFRDHLLALSDMGIPIGLQDFRDVVKRYLDNIGKIVPVFKYNSPGYEWAKLYIERHPAIKEKIAHKISRKRAQVNEVMVNEFFDRLEKEIEDVSPDNIYNMDESGFHDDPGKKKLLFRRSTRHPEQVKNSSKSCFTVIFAGNAIGDIIPPFFIFKGKHCWSDWLVNAPKLSKMAVSSSGWIDADIFQEWLENHFVPIVNKKEGKKILICDNLSAHISVKALKICEENNIKFICLIPNSTHLLQPLDVGYFSSLKSAWRTVLNKWRQTQRGRKTGALPKNVFCQLMNSALQINESTAGINLIAGFRKCGIFPCSRTEVLQLLPSYATGHIQATVGETFKEYLQEIRASDLNIKTTKKFQLPVKAGKSISAEEVELFYKNRQKEQEKKNENPMKKGRPKGSKNKKTTKKSDIQAATTAKTSNDLPKGDDSQIESFEVIVTAAEVYNEPKQKQNLEVPETLNLELDNIEELIVTSVPTPENEEEVIDDCIGEFSQEKQQNRQSKPREMIIEEITRSKLQNKRKKTSEINTCATKKPKFNKNYPKTKDIDLNIIEQCKDVYVPAHDIHQPPLMLPKETELPIESCNETISGEYIIDPDNGQLVKLRETFEVNQYCVFIDEGSLFPGRIIRISYSPFEIQVSCLNKRFEGGWTWPSNPDITKISNLKVIKKVIAEENIKRNGNVVYIEDDFLYLEWGE